jgi:hypothetical protein
VGESPNLVKASVNCPFEKPAAWLPASGTDVPGEGEGAAPDPSVASQSAFGSVRPFAVPPEADAPNGGVAGVSAWGPDSPAVARSASGLPAPGVPYRGFGVGEAYGGVPG